MKNFNSAHYDHESRIVRLEVTIENIDKTLTAMNKRFDQIDRKFESIEKKMWFQFFFLLTTIGGLGTIMAHGFHWF